MVTLALPVLWWCIPLGVDSIAAALLLVLVLKRSSSAAVAAVAFHYAALPVAAGVWIWRSRHGLELACLCTLLAVALAIVTPYGSAIPVSAWAAARALPAFVVVMTIALAPALAVRLSPLALRQVAAVGLGTSFVVLYATTAHVYSHESFGLSVFATSRYALPLTVVLLVVGQVDGRTERPKTAPGKGHAMRLKTFALSVAVAALGALVLASTALAVTVPDVPVDDYGNALLDGLVQALTNIFPFAAAITAFAIGVGMVKRWLGHRKATRV